MPTSSGFRIHSIMLVKNEADIVAHTLREATEWSDAIYVYDNGSTDGTWEIVQRMADSRIIPFKQDDKPFQDWLRCEAFENFRSRSRPGDWWCRLDGDEIYLDNARTFLRALKRHEMAVWNISIDYYLTSDDLTCVNFSAPIETWLTRLRHYRISHSELRFFRYRDGLQWSPPSPWPRHTGPVARRRIRLRHYKYRSPTQIQVRMDVRRQAAAAGYQSFSHAIQRDWKDKIAGAESVYLDSGNGNFVYDAAALPDHLGPRWKRIVVRAMHGLGVWP